MERVNQACAYLAKDFWPHLTHPPCHQLLFFPPRQYTCHTLSLSLSFSSFTTLCPVLVFTLIWRRIFRIQQSGLLSDVTWPIFLSLPLLSL